MGSASPGGSASIAKRMDVALHQVIDRGVNQSMPEPPRISLRNASDNDPNSEVALPAAQHPAWPRVKVTFILYGECQGKAALQPFAQTLPRPCAG